MIIFDSVLDEPHWSARLCTPASSEEVRRDLNVAVTRSKSKFVFIGSSAWLNKHAKPSSGLGQMWEFLKSKAMLISAYELVEKGFADRVSHLLCDHQGWRIPNLDEGTRHEILDETNFFERFSHDIEEAAQSIFGLVPFFGEYRWPRIQPWFYDALRRKVEITLVTPPISEASDPTYVKSAITNLRSLGAVVITATGLHGKDVVIDGKIHYTGSLNWASHRGRSEIMHRTESHEYAKLVLKYLQARYIREAATDGNGTPRNCPYCHSPVHVVNQIRNPPRWDHQPMKIGCTNKDCNNYLRDIDERLPFRSKPVCQLDKTTKYRRVRKGKGEEWQCPKHPQRCPTCKVIPGDPD